MYDPTIDYPATLGEVIVFSQWRDSQLTWSEELVANFVFIEAESGRTAIFDYIMAGNSVIPGHNPFHGSVRS